MTSSRSRRGRGGQGGYEPRARIRTRELRVLELATQGWSQHQIAADLGVSQAAVSKALQRIELRGLQELSDSLARQKVRQAMRLEHVYAEAMHAWEESKADATRKTQRKTQPASGETGSIAELVVENSHGDPRYLSEARQALADTRKLLGLDAPQKLDLRASRNPYDAMSEDDLRVEVARQAQLLSSASPVTVEPISAEASSAAQEIIHGHTEDSTD